MSTYKRRQAGLDVWRRDEGENQTMRGGWRKGEPAKYLSYRTTQTIINEISYSSLNRKRLTR
jgi:hypothetical protein